MWTQSISIVQLPTNSTTLILDFYCIVDYVVQSNNLLIVAVVTLGSREIANRDETAYYSIQMLARKEKQNLVIKLYKQDKTVREIAQESHMSFSDIGTIIKQEFGDKDVNKDAQIFKLFEKGTKLLDIAIEFNISANEVQRLHREYRTLCEMNELNKIYDEYGDKIGSLIQLYETMQKLGLSSEEIAKAVKYGSDLPVLELRYQNLDDEAEKIEAQKQNLISETENLQSAASVLNSAIANLDKVVDHKINKIKLIDSEIQKLQNRLFWIKESKRYAKIRGIARQQVQTILKDKRALLLTTLIAIIEAFKMDPENQILISNTRDVANQSYHMEQRKKFLEIGEQIFDGLADDLVSVTMNSISDLGVQ